MVEKAAGVFRAGEQHTGMESSHSQLENQKER